ncbi:hypothetical protein BLNAU_2535 [Blattamonas nauphoetae]|uniref:Myb-like domain-containing protein n=1 Tax=Blattamonas nauphoetae TaxID=2049346 RepID=A0ABQ9YFZ7_9EUKA|nr:hypothetical protein BLNAU_2535 [Blattamonas nauphoetae]
MEWELNELAKGLRVNKSWEEIADRIKQLGGDRTPENCAMRMYADKWDLKKNLQLQGKGSDDGETTLDEAEERFERQGSAFDVRHTVTPFRPTPKLLAPFLPTLLPLALFHPIPQLITLFCLASQLLIPMRPLRTICYQYTTDPACKECFSSV